MAGFHEAVGDTIALSVSTPAHLRKIGLLAEGEDNYCECAPPPLSPTFTPPPHPIFLRARNRVYACAHMFMCVCVRACVRACVSVSVRAYVLYVCVRACVRARARACVCVYCSFILTQCSFRVAVSKTKNKIVYT